MKSVFLICLFSFFAAEMTFALPSVNPERQVPTITPSYFYVGQTWVWKHYEDEQLYSTEKYTVLSARPDEVLFEMSTKLPSQTQFVRHHRIIANPQRCLLAHKNPAGYKPWAIQLYFWDKDHWSFVEGLDKTLVFEEKFNCNPHVFQTPYRKTIFQTFPTPFGLQELFQQAKGREHESSFFFSLPPSAGVMAYKNMSLPGEKPQYTIRFSLED